MHKSDNFLMSTLQLPAFDDVNILVVGELVLDKYLWGKVERISPEAPVPVIRVHSREARPGNAAFVCASLRSLGASVSLVSVIGADDEGRALRQMLGSWNVRCNLIEDPTRPTIVKQRLFGSVQAAMRGTQQLLRFDEEDPRPLEPPVEELVLRAVLDQIPKCDGILVSDINKGLLTENVARALIENANREGVPVIIDPRLGDDMSIYRGATALTPNRFETERATRISLKDKDTWEAASQSMLKGLNLDLCLITLDRQGMFLCARDGTRAHLPTKPLEIDDVTGAGDVALSVFGLCLVAGLPGVAAGRMANIAAGLEVRKHGANIISRDELASALMGEDRKSEHKVMPLKDLVLRLARHRDAGHTISFVDGVFAALYSEDLDILQAAKSRGDILVVGIAGDHFDKSEEGGVGSAVAKDRARLVAALDAVDYVTICKDGSVESAIRVVKPDVLLKRVLRGNEMVDWQAEITGSMARGAGTES
jgi:D-beta-D-heptose 7-phosphate kinase / D-beta-D-heptose 1-phosphate adenosyltransferase